MANNLIGRVIATEKNLQLLMILLSGRIAILF